MDNLKIGKIVRLLENSLTREIFHRTVSEQEHPRLCKESGQDMRVHVVVWAVDGVRTDSKYTNEHGQYHHETPQLFDLKFDITGSVVIIGYKKRN